MAVPHRSILILLLSSTVTTAITVMRLASVSGAEPNPPTQATIQANARFQETLAFQDREDFADARRGFIAQLPSTVARDEAGHIIWDMDQYAFFGRDTEPPDTVNPSLWRQSQLNAIHGLPQHSMYS
jgi:alkyl sulfatase BDS1-like metallo-beta-lactamase superfamily hydrolase